MEKDVMKICAQILETTVGHDMDTESADTIVKTVIGILKQYAE